MFPWEGKEIAEIDALMSERDPRRYRLGLLTDTIGGKAPALVWFSGRSELAHYLARVEPRRRGLEGLDYIHVRDALQEGLAGLEIRGTRPELRDTLNTYSHPAFMIRWWGTLEALRQGDDPWAKDLMAAMSPPATPPLPPRRTAELLDQLRQYAPCR